MRVGYAKLGRTMGLTPAGWGEVGGDNEPPALLKQLAAAHPNVEWVLVGRNSGENPTDVGLPSNVTNPWQQWTPEWKKINKAKKEHDQSWYVDALIDLTHSEFQSLDSIVVWLGQHGTTNSPIPSIEDPLKLTNPQESFIAYSSYIIRNINLWRDEDPRAHQEIWLIPDARNYVKGRDLKWPPPTILGQFDFQRKDKHYRYGDPRHPSEFADICDAEWVHEQVWHATHNYIGSGLELTGVIDFGDDLPGFDGRVPFGILINEARSYVADNRLRAMQEYVLPLSPDWIHGTWSEDSLKKLRMRITPISYGEVYGQLATARTTFTTPSSGSGWATAKPWECFSVGTVCFFHPKYDTQGHVIPTLEQVQDWPKDNALRILVEWLRVRTPEELEHKVKAVSSSRDTWEYLKYVQRWWFTKAKEDNKCMNLIAQKARLLP